MAVRCAPSVAFASSAPISGGAFVRGMRANAQSVHKCGGWIRPPVRARPPTPRRCCVMTVSGRDVAGAAVRESGAVLARLDAKRVLSWVAFAAFVLACRPFFPVMLGTFIVGYVANSATEWAVARTGGRAPRRLFVSLFYTVIITAIAGFSLMTVPTVVRESQYFISTLQSENPYVIIANVMRKSLGDDLATKVESYVSYSLEHPALFGAAPALSSPGVGQAVPSALPAPAEDTEPTEWSEERSRRLGVLLQRSIRGYVSGTVALITRLLGASTKVVFKALLSLVFSFMIMWDLPRIVAGVRRLKHSRLAFMYEEVVPVITQFGSVLGKSFEAQSAIALVNTTLTTAGLMFLAVPGVGFLSVVTLICSFIPVAGVFISTLPMVILALSEYGVSKALAVVVMVILVHLVEAYVLNPQIYSAHLQLHPLFVIVVLYVAEHSFGIPGLLMAVPVAVYLLRTIMPSPSSNDTALEMGAAGAGSLSAAANGNKSPSTGTKLVSDSN